MKLCRLCLFGLALGLAAGVAPADVYRWVDEDGTVHYSDEPREGAERLELGEPATVQTPDAGAAPAREEPEAPEEAEREADDEGYERFAITSPQPEQTIQSAPGRVPVALALQPQLREGHAVTLLLDGEPVQQSPLEGLELTLEPVDRGTHTLEARVTDDRGEVLARTDRVTFYLHRPSVNLPARQGN